MSVAGEGGLRAIVHRHSAAKTIRTAIDRVLEGDDYVDPAVAAIARAARDAWLMEISVTGREISVLEGVQHGHTNTEIARRLGCTVRTVKFHVSNLLRKCGVASRFALVRRLAEFDLEVTPAAE